MVEAKYGNKLKNFLMDHGCEFMLGDFIAFCKEYGIKNQLTNDHTSQKIYFSKQNNRLIIEMGEICSMGWSFSTPFAPSNENI